MKNTFEITKGMEVWLEPTGNNARPGRQAVKGEIISIGRKYFYVSVPSHPHWANVKFDLEEFRSHYDDNAGFIIYPSFEAYKAEKTLAAKLREIREAILYAQNINRIPGHKTIPSNDAVDKIYQILRDEELVPEWKEEMINGR